MTRGIARRKSIVVIKAKVALVFFTVEVERRERERIGVWRSFYSLLPNEAGAGDGT
jgi:hypothetical protein